MSKVDPVTSFIRRATDLLLLKNPLGTSVGAFSGVALHGFIRLWSPILQRNALLPGEVTLYHCVALGVLICNLRRLLSRRRLPPQIEDAFEAIQRLEGKLSTTQLRMQYMALCARVLELQAASDAEDTASTASKNEIGAA